jgi:hypothetical protein
MQKEKKKRTFSFFQLNIFFIDQMNYCLIVTTGCPLQWVLAHLGFGSLSMLADDGNEFGGAQLETIFFFYNVSEF